MEAADRMGRLLLLAAALTALMGCRTDEGVKARGQITIKGVTKDVEVEGTSTGPIVDGYGNGRIGLQLSAVVDRTGFGLEWNTPLPTGEPALSNDVRIVTDLQFVKGS